MLSLLKKTIGVCLAAVFLPLAVFAAAITPNDSLYGEQRAYLEQMRIPEAWSITTGSREVVIAAIDSGVDMDHPDIIANMWFNKGEKPLNGIDDDNNGYVDDLNGWDFLQNVSDPHPKFENGFNFGGAIHGTAVAGIAAAASNNAEGIAGVCWQCQIMALRALDSTGQGDPKIIAKAIDYAIGNGADIINMSFVGAIDESAMSLAAERAYEAGVILVAAVGNDADNGTMVYGDLDFRPLYPVCSDGPAGQNQILGVGSVDGENQKSPFSNYGFTCIDIMAYGDGLVASQLYEPKKGKNFQEQYKAGLKGTSMAAPVVAGIAGLVKSANLQLSNSQVIDIIKQTGRDIGSANPFYSGQLGSGLIDAAAAARLAKITAGMARTGVGTPAKNIIIATGGGASKIKIVDKVGKVKAEFSPFPSFFRGEIATARADVNGDGLSEIIVGAGPGGGPQVRIFSESGQLVSQFFAYDKNFRGGVRLAAADFDGDGKAEIATSSGAGALNEIRVYDYLGRKLWFFSAEGAGVRGTANVSAGDIDGDGKLEIITGADSGSLPVVRIFDKLGNKKTSFSAYPSFFRRGVKVAVGDLDGDVVSEIVVAAGMGGGPQIRIFDGKGNVLRQSFAFEKNFRGGANVAVGNIDSDAEAEIIVGAGPGRAAEVKTFTFKNGELSQETNFSLVDFSNRAGVNVGI